MYIKLTALPDKSGEYYNVLVNTYRVIGMREGITKDFFDKVKKDEHGYPETFTEIITRGASFFVTQTLDEIQSLIKEAHDEVGKESWINQPNV
jgi:hypothetical protein|tara:strand:+ start:328 stop:606 length:279 start_codon:yes stop_codon:yes gene_type:complete